MEDAQHEATLPPAEKDEFDHTTEQLGEMLADGHRSAQTESATLVTAVSDDTVKDHSGSSKNV